MSWIVAGAAVASSACASAVPTVTTTGPDASAEAAEADGAGEGAADGAARVCPSMDRLEDAGVGLSVMGCSVGDNYLTCKYASGESCECVSDDPTKCVGCGVVDASAVCKGMCAADQYAVACGGPPGPDYQKPPAGCAVVATSPSGSMYSCCPCE